MSEVVYVRFMHNCVAYTDLDIIMSDIRKCATFEFFRFIFRFRPKMSCIFIFRLFFGRKIKLHIRLFYFSTEKEKIIFGRPLDKINIVTHLTKVKHCLLYG